MPSLSSTDDQHTAKVGGEFRPLIVKELNHRRFRRNLKAWTKRFPDAGAELEAIKTTHSCLVADDGGDFDIAFRGDMMFGGGSKKWAKKRVKDFSLRSGAQRLIASPMDTANLDDVANVTIYNILNTAVREHGIKFATVPVNERGYHLVVLGVGLGDHIPILTKATNCQNLILLEPNLEFLYLSMFTFDWVGLFKEFDGVDKKIWFIGAKSSTRMALYIRDYLRLNGPHFIDGTFLFEAYPNSIMHAAVTGIMDNANVLLHGLGFLEDEFDMVRNAYHNFKNFEGRYYKHDKSPTFMPAFVIGSGPSLDNDLEMIRKNQDRAIIVSCGSAIRILLLNGIVPDFQMEMENVPAVTEITEKLSETNDLSQITLVASNTVDPGVSPFYGRTIFYIRPSLASSLIFDMGDDAGIDCATPTVSNLGFSFAQEIGCQTVYTFGVDMGARNPKQHHANDAAYNVGQLEFTTEINTPAPGNFGGTVMSETIYLWGVDMLVIAAQRFAGVHTYYNCSDGVRIEGMIPKLSSTVALPERPEKQNIVEAIIEKFPFYTADDFRKAWTDRNPRRRIKEYRNRLLACCDYPEIDDFTDEDGNDGLATEDETTETAEPVAPGRRSKKRREAYELDYLVRINLCLVPRGEPVTAEVHYYRGSMFLSMIGLNFFVARTPPGEKRETVIELGKQALCDQIIRICDAVLEFYDTLETPTEETPAN